MFSDKVDSFLVCGSLLLMGICLVRAGDPGELEDQNGSLLPIGSRVRRLAGFADRNPISKENLHLNGFNWHNRHFGNGRRITGALARLRGNKRIRSRNVNRIIHERYTREEQKKQKQAASSYLDSHNRRQQDRNEQQRNDERNRQDAVTAYWRPWN